MNDDVDELAGPSVHASAIAERRATRRLNGRPKPHPSSAPPTAAARQRPEILSRDTQPRTETRVRVVLRAPQARGAGSRRRATSTGRPAL